MGDISNMMQKAASNDENYPDTPIRQYITAGERAKDDDDECRGEETVICPRCNNPMLRMQTCHMFCTNCGAHLDCSDKGAFW